ncbi:MAG: B12-binding domain-containing radical SAM protein [Armatimonadota bacterium]
MSENGAAIVLTADRTLMSDYDLLFDAMIACSQTTTTPRTIMDSLLLPRVRHTSGQADVAPLGLRRIQGALRTSDFCDDDIAVVDDRHLRRAIGPDTRVIGVSTGEPLGMGMSSTTMTAIAGGRIYPAVLFEELMDALREIRDKNASGARIVVGGPGGWQLEDDAAARSDRGVDHLITGCAEGNIARIFRRLLSGEDVESVIEGEGCPANDMPPLSGPTVMGACEMSRGCGRGCSFCTLADEPMRHVPPSTIVKDVETNVEAGNENVTLLSEDLLRYGSDGGECNQVALMELLRDLRRMDSLNLIQADHANVASIAEFSDAELALVKRLLVGEQHDWASWLNIGVETASGRLMAENSCRAKMVGVEPDEWGEFAATQVRRLSTAGFIPLVSLIIGLPGETDEDVAATLEWVQSLRTVPVCIFPVIFAPVKGETRPEPERMSSGNWHLIAECYEKNFRWVPRLYYEQQAAAEVSLARRAVMRILGNTQACLWRRKFARHIRRAGQ